MAVAVALLEFVVALTTPTPPTLKKSPPIAPVRSMPSRCWALTWFATASVMRPSSLRAGSSISRRQSSSPPSVPPETLREMSIVPDGDCSASFTRSGSSGSDTVVICEATLPSTSGWPVPMKTLIADSPSATTVTPILDESWSIIASR